ncbi:hypothetical protein QYS48_27490 [Marivirga arenosa]|uniref:Outer membrane protein beta-barrel domain-containing protein n=1 Tax=Marivirga arenosa TaxID=3059076 RepID=A0AA51RAP7_9BACT|nr:hypothetical protein [Marivirga sp. ABR2-2]WMN07013.1 hypothetical protein QYS48_27490 [Marivirga sp. ABR2-2]
MKKTISCILLILNCSFASAQSETSNLLRPKASIQIGSGFPGILLIDELTTDKRFDRIAIPLISLSFNYKLNSRLSSGIYFGIEHEKQSGTIINFEGPTISTVSGIYLNYHLKRKRNLSLFDPYVGLSVFYYSLEKVISSPIIPSLRIGFNFFGKNKIFGNLNIGTGVALGEFSIGYHL